MDFLLDRLHRVQLMYFNAENANGRAEMETHGCRRAGPTSVVSWFCNDVLTVVDLEPAVEAGWQQAVKYLPARERMCVPSVTMKNTREPTVRPVP